MPTLEENKDHPMGEIIINPAIFDRMAREVHGVPAEEEVKELRELLADREKVIKELRPKVAGLETEVRNLTAAINSNKIVTELKAKVTQLEQELEYIKDSSFQRADSLPTNMEPISNKTLSLWAKWDDCRDLLFPALRICMNQKVDARMIGDSSGRIVDVQPMEV